MSSLDRPLAGKALHFRLAEERAHVVDPEILARQGRNGRTLVKDGPLRVTLVALAAGGRIAPHRADGPITVQVVEGALTFHVAGGTFALAPSELLAVGAGEEHAVESATGAVFLLTVVQKETPPEGGGTDR